MTTFVFDARTATPHFPGIGRYVAGLLPALAAQLAQEERLVLLCTDAAQAAQFGTVTTSNAAVSVRYVQADAFSFAQQWRVRRVVRSLAAPDEALVYHSPYYLMPYWTGVRTVLTVHDLIPLLLPETVSPRARLLFRITHRLALHSADRIISVSKVTASDLTGTFGVDRSHIAVIPHGVEPRFRPQPQAEIDRVRAAFTLPETFVLYLGINKPHKNLVNLVQAYALLSEETPPLVIAGAWDPRYPEAKDAASRLGLTDRVRFLGPVHDAELPGLYSAATLFVFPSRYEGFGLPVLEAMACGAPVIASNVSSLPEVVGNAALTVNPDDVEQLALAIRTLLASPELRLALRDAGLTNAKTFTWDVCAAKTLAIYRGVR